MTRQPDWSSDNKFANLRQRAEKLLKNNSSESQKLAYEEINQLVHDLHVYQIELELQNEELRDAQRQIEISRNQYAQLYDLAPVGYFTLDANGLILKANLAGANLLGVNRKFLTRKPLAVFVARDSHEKFSIHRRQVLETEQRQACELTMVSRKGEKFFVRLESIAVHDPEAPETLRLLTAIWDITARKRMMEQLQTNERYFRSLIENGSDIIQVLDAEGNHRYISPSISALLGYSVEEIMRCDAFEFIHPDDLPTINEDFQKLLAQPNWILSREVRVRNKSGQWRTLDVTARNLLDDPTINGVVVNSHDKTEYKEVLDVLKVSEQRLRLLVENLPAGAVYVDGDSLFVNKATEEITGYNRVELGTVSRWFEKLYDADQEKIRRYYEDDKRSGFVEPRTVSIRRKDGQLRMVQFVGYYNAQAEIWLLTDVTEKYLAEQRLKASLKEKEVLLKEIHHRVKNNLQIVHSLLSLQADYFSDPRAIEALLESQNRVRSMALVHEKLYQSDDLARVNPGGYIESLTAQLFNSYQNMARIVKLETAVDQAVTLDIDLAVPCGLIINELVTNSLKHAFSGGNWPEGQGKIVVRLRRNGLDQTLLSVADNGVGLPADLDFYDPSSLGLQLVNMLTHQLDGELRVNSPALSGRGTEVTIVFGP